MNIYKSFLVLFLIIFMNLGCFTTPCVDPQILISTNWDNLNLEDFILEFGDVIELKNSKIKGVVIDFSKDEYENWYGICLMNENQLFGRSIYNGCSKNCMDMLDLTHFNESLLDSLNVNEKLILDINKIRIGGHEMVTSKAQVESSFKQYKSLRKQTPTPCDNKNWNLKAINECYFEVSSILLPIN